ncbi:MAG: hypothetical protein ACJAT2_003595 [Bacteriovoracaceae bacterium]|jgi:hypothetical protein
MKPLKVYTKLIISLLVISISSCTSFIEKLTEDKTPLRPLEDKPTYCTEDVKQLSVLGRDKGGVKLFEKLLGSLPIERRLNKTEKIVVWSLIQMNLRPDLATPSARFQILLDSGKGIQYWDFKDATLERDFPRLAPPMTFLYGLETILKTYSPRSSLRSLARLIDTYLSKKIPISEELAFFIGRNKEKLLENKVFEKSYFKAKEQLRFGETLSKLSFTNIISQYYKYKKQASSEIKISNELYSLDIDTSSLGKEKEDAFCNVDLGKYSTNKNEISIDNRDRHHPFGLRFNQKSFFLGITSIATSNFRPLFNTYLIDSSQDETIAPLCYRESQDGVHAYLSFKGRDPGQHLFNLFQFKIHSTSIASELDQFLDHPRHLLLKKPIRILYESDRGNENSLNNFLKKDVPVYHSSSLGEVWLYNPKNGFILDKRGRAHLSCLK